MKTLITVLTLCVLATNVFSQVESQNYMGTRWDPNSSTYDAFCNYQQEDEIVTFSLYLNSPVNPDFADGEVRAVTNVSGFDCDVTVTEGAFVLGWNFPSGAQNYGSGSSLNVLFSEPIPVVDGQALLATFDVFFGGPISFELPENIIPRCVNNDNCWLYVNPANPASIPGFVSFTDADDPSDPAVAGVCTGSVPDMSFEIYQAQPVANATGSWDYLKAFYR